MQCLVPSWIITRAQVDLYHSRLDKWYEKGLLKLIMLQMTHMKDSTRTMKGVDVEHKQLNVKYAKLDVNIAWLNYYFGLALPWLNIVPPPLLSRFNHPSPIIPSAHKGSSRHFIFHRKCVSFEPVFVIRVPSKPLAHSFGTIPSIRFLFWYKNNRTYRISMPKRTHFVLFWKQNGWRGKSGYAIFPPKDGRKLPKEQDYRLFCLFRSFQNQNRSQKNTITVNSMYSHSGIVRQKNAPLDCSCDLRLFNLLGELSYTWCLKLVCLWCCGKL